MALSQSYDVFKPTIWTPRFNYFLKKKLVAKEWAKDYSAQRKKGSLTVNIPHIGDNFSASSISTTNGEVTATNVSDTKSALTLDQWFGTSHVFTKYDAETAMNSPKLLDDYAMAMSYALADKFDGVMTGEFDNLTPSVGSSATSLVATNIEKGIGIAESNSVRISECKFVFSPKTYWRDVAAIQKYYDASQVGKPAEVATGQRGSLYNVPVLVTENVEAFPSTGSYNALIHPTAIIYAMRDIELENKYDTSLTVRPTADLMYGYKVLNAKRGVQLLSKR